MDITTLASDGARAQFLADNVGDPEGAIRVLMDGIDAHLSATGSDKLPEDLCGPVMGTVGACMVGALAARFTAGPNGDEWDGDPIELLIKGQIAAQTVEHAAFDHGDNLARAIRYPHGVEDASLGQSYDAIVDWVTEVLWDLADIDPDLLLIGTEDDSDSAA